ncbi:hypothetical protein ACROYT_G037634 [Oculina patagonica]
MAANGCRNFLKFASVQSFYHVSQRGILEGCRSVACFPAIGVVPSVTGILGVRYAYQPKQKQQQKHSEVPSYRIGVTKSQDSIHTGSLKGSLWASDRLLDDIMIRKFVEGVMHGFLESEVWRHSLPLEKKFGSMKKQVKPSRMQPTEKNQRLFEQPHGNSMNEVPTSAFFLNKCPIK